MKQNGALDTLLFKARTRNLSVRSVPTGWRDGVMNMYRREFRERVFILTFLFFLSLATTLLATGSLFAVTYRIWKMIPPLPIGGFGGMAGSMF